MRWSNSSPKSSSFPDSSLKNHRHCDLCEEPYDEIDVCDACAVTCCDKCKLLDEPVDLWLEGWNAAVEVERHSGQLIWYTEEQREAVRGLYKK